MDIRVEFPGGKRVDAHVGGYVVRTDQPVEGGGEGSAPGPFDLFLAAMATCAGFYALSFCQARGIDPIGLSLTERVDLDPTTHLPVRVTFELGLPAGFPERMKPGIRKAVDQCKVKRTFAAAPIFEVTFAEPCVGA